MLCREFVVVILFLILSVSVTARDPRRIFLLASDGDESFTEGRGGGPVGNSTSLIQHFINSGFETRVLFGNENEYARRVIKSSITGKPVVFDRFTHQSLMDQVDKIKKMNLQAPDQVVLYVSSHGIPNNQQQTHSITDATGLLQSLDYLVEFRNQLSKRGVKLLIADTSCFSGSMMELADKNTCVISGAGKHSEGTLWFDKYFAENINKTSNAEEAFLRGRLQNPEFLQPNISTYAGLTLMNYETRLELFQDGGVRRGAKSDICKIPNPTGKIVREVHGAVDHLLPLGALDKRARGLIGDYSREFQKLAQLTGESELMKSKIEGECQKISFPESVSCGRFMKVNISDEIVRLEGMKKSPATPLQKEWCDSLCDKLLAGLRQIQGLGSRPPNGAVGEAFKNLEELKVNIKGLLRRIEMQGYIVNEKERQLYDYIYRRNSTVGKAQQNPCATFKWKQ